MQRLIDKSSNKYAMLVEYLKELDKIVDFVSHHVCCMAVRYDERVAMIINNVKVDSFQRDLIGRVYKNEAYQNKKLKMLKKKTYVKFHQVEEDSS